MNNENEMDKTMFPNSFYMETLEPSCQIDHEILCNIYTNVFGKKLKGYFVEVGAYDGKTFSNTYGLSLLGWHGLYIEPVPHLMNQCKINHAFNKFIKYFERPISNEYKINVPFFVGDWASTLCQEVVNVNPHLNKSRFFNIDVYPLDMVFERLEVPYDFDLLVIDTEGNDRKVLEGFTIHKYQPKLVIVEYNQKGIDWFMSYFNPRYDLIFRDTVNLIFKRN